MFKNVKIRKCEEHKRALESDLVREDQVMHKGIQRAVTTSRGGQIIIWFCPDCLKEQGISKGWDDDVYTKK